MPEINTNANFSASRELTNEELKDLDSVFAENNDEIPANEISLEKSIEEIFVSPPTVDEQPKS
ncbi:MAG: hypothetical protein ABUK01_15405 [Leptospirales bacterium]